jgi:hypothetical protein
MFPETNWDGGPDRYGPPSASYFVCAPAGPGGGAGTLAGAAPPGAAGAPAAGATGGGVASSAGLLQPAAIPINRQAIPAATAVNRFSIFMSPCDSPSRVGGNGASIIANTRAKENMLGENYRITPFCPTFVIL